MSVLCVRHQRFIKERGVRRVKHVRSAEVYVYSIALKGTVVEEILYVLEIIVPNTIKSMLIIVNGIRGTAEFV